MDDDQEEDDLRAEQIRASFIWSMLNEIALEKERLAADPENVSSVEALEIWEDINEIAMGSG